MTERKQRPCEKVGEGWRGMDGGHNIGQGWARAEGGRGEANLEEGMLEWRGVEGREREVEAGSGA